LHKHWTSCCSRAIFSSPHYAVRQCSGRQPSFFFCLDFNGVQGCSERRNTNDRTARMLAHNLPCVAKCASHTTNQKKSGGR